MTRWKALPWLLGVAALAVSLVAALRMNADTPVNTGAGGPPAQPFPSAPVGGLTISGVVDPFPHPVARLDAPAVLGMTALTVEKVLVADGDPVEPGQVLVEFNTGGMPHKLTQAEKELIAALWDAESARALRDDHPRKVDQQKLAIRKAESDLKLATDARNTLREIQDRVLGPNAKDFSGKPLTEEEKAQRRKENIELQKSEALVETLKFAVEKEQNELKRLEAVPANADVERVNAKVEVIRAKIEEAKAVIEGFKLKAQVAGTVEHVKAVPGMTYGPTAREPLMYLVPSGKRVVRGEVPAEFAHKIAAYRGKTVTVTEAQHPAHTYTGKLTRIPTAFLPKRFGGESLVAEPPRVLDCLIELADPTPAGNPPLLPGQQVWVVFGQ